MAGGGDGILAAVVAATEVFAAAGRGGRDQRRLPLLVHSGDLGVEVDLDPVAFSVGEGRPVREVFEARLNCGADDPVARQSKQLLYGDDRVGGVWGVHAVDRTGIEVQRFQ